MQRLVLFATVAMALLSGGEVPAQERPLDARMMLETRQLGEKLLRESVPHESGRKDSRRLVSTLREHHLSVQIFDAIEYLQEKHGKVPLYSILENKISLELGLFGYLGIKWRF
jgi:hypothetical protein